MRAFLISIPLIVLAAPAFAQGQDAAEDFLEAIAEALREALDDTPDPDEDATSPEVEAAATPPADALTIAAEEHIAETLPVDANRRSDVEGGFIWPGCTLPYPDQRVAVDGANQDPTGADPGAVRIAVDSVYLRQNLELLGIEPLRAQTLAADYAAARRQHDALTRSERRAAYTAGQSPDHLLLTRLNSGAAGTAVLPPIAEPINCDNYMLSRMQNRTRYLLTPQPETAQVFVLPRFSFRLCELRQRDPYDRSQCQDWVDVSGQSASLMGRYAVMANWNDGRRSRSTRRFEYIDNANVHTVVITPDPN